MDNSMDQRKVSRHGAHAAVRAYRAGKPINKRTRLGRYLKMTREDFIKDLGGEPNIAQRILLDRIMEKLLFLQIIGEYAREQGKDVIKEGRLIACLGENYIAYDNALQRNIRALYEIEARNKEIRREEQQDAYLNAITGRSKST